MTNCLSIDVSGFSNSIFANPNHLGVTRGRVTHARRAHLASASLGVDGYATRPMSDLERGVSDERAPLRPTDGRSASPSSAPSKRSFLLMVAFAVLGLAATLGSFVSSWGGDIVQVLQLASHKKIPVSFMHVPRTGGATLRFTAPQLGVPITGEERCYKYVHRERMINAALFRDPREHVLSQFSHCFANPHGAASMSPLWGFPRGNKGDTPKLGWMNGLSKWLKHFGEDWRREDGYFNCFNPINMQARYLTCGAKDEVKDKAIGTGAERWGTPDDPGRAVWFQSAHYLGANDAAEPDLDKVIRRLDSMQVVGVTEAMKATTCLIEYHSRGTVHPQCECGSDDSKFPWKEERNEAYQPYAFADISEKNRELVMNVTRADRLVHRYAVKRLIRDSMRAEEKMGKKFLCSATRRALDAILDEHEDGELEAALDGPWDEYRPSGKSLHHKAEASMGAVAALRPFAASARSAKRTYTAAEQEALMVRMQKARAAEVLPREALEEGPMTHFEYSR